MVLGLSLREVVEAAPWVWADRPSEKVRTWTATGVVVDRLGSLDAVDQGIQDADRGSYYWNSVQDEDQNQVNPLVVASE